MRFINMKGLLRRPPPHTHTKIGPRINLAFLILENGQFPQVCITSRLCRTPHLCTPLQFAIFAFQVSPPIKSWSPTVLRCKGYCGHNLTTAEDCAKLVPRWWGQDFQDCLPPPRRTVTRCGSVASGGTRTSQQATHQQSLVLDLFTLECHFG